ncbi:YcxB family protein [Marinilabiliaceae bacterium JC017]|nr:YcxB family protein [Marinilabiliaceae bacterium JC017]
MKIEFEFDANDWMAFHMHYINSSKQFKRSKLLTTLIFPLVLLALIVFNLVKGDYDLSSIAVLAVLAILWVIFMPGRFTKKTIHKARKIIMEADNSAVMGIHKIEFTTTGIVHVQPQAEHTINWDGIKKVEETADYFFLYITSVSAIIIPKQKIGTDVEKVATILKRHKG